MGWNNSDGIDVTAAFQGITTPLRELYDEIHQRGWNVQKVDVNGDGQYEATVKNPYGETLAKVGPDPNTAIGHCLIGIMRQETMRYPRTAAWKATWEKELPDIAKAYADAPAYDPKAAGAWKELAEDSQRRAEAIANQIRVEFTHDPYPYDDVNEMAKDIREKQHVTISKANLSHPLWSTDQALAYRLVHDVLGHASVGGDWGWHGENGATSAHMPLLSPNAQKALFTEAIGQAAHNNFYRAFGPQKIAFLDDFIEPSQEKENASGFGGVHPSQSIVQTQIPTIETPEEKIAAIEAESPWIAPSYEIPTDIRNQLSAYAETLPWGNGTEMMDPAKYHITSFFAPEGYNDPSHQRWLQTESVGGFPVTTHSLRRNPNLPNQLILQVDAPSLARHAGELATKAMGRGIPVTPSKGGYLPHVTLGTSKGSSFPIDEFPIDQQPPRIQFNTGSLYELHNYYDQLDHTLSHLSNSSPTQLDPNDGWSSGLEPLPDNAYLWQKEESGLDPLDHQGIRDQAYKLDSGWFGLQDHEGVPDLESHRQAVANAFRSTLLEPRQTPRWAATHYQHIQNVPAGVSDPMRFTDTLEAQRNAHNKARGLPEDVAHSEYAEGSKALAQWVKTMNPTLDDSQVNEIVRKELFHMIAEEEERATADDASGQLLPMQISQAVNKAMKKRLAVITKPRVDQKFDFGKDRLFHKSFNAPDPGVYGDFLHSHVKPIAGVGLNIHHLTRAAREDVTQHGGTGHHFRAKASDLIPGVGPREISNAWYKLQPHTSQLGVIGPAVAETLGHGRDKEVSSRDYFKLERQLAAGRDAAGYGHVPLGQFSSGMYDNMNYGHGVHRDLSPFKAVNPTPYDQVDWTQYPNLATQGWTNPYWWKSTEPNRDQIGIDWDQMVAVKHPAQEIPYRTASIPAQEFPITPYVNHPVSGEQIEGDPGVGLMEHVKNSLGLSTEEIWAADPEVGKR